MHEQALVLAVEDLRFQYVDRQIVDIAHCQLQAGQSMAVIGPSGCGKTTFLHLLAGLLRPAHGSIRILDQDIVQMSATQLDRYRGAHVGMVFQRLFLLPGLSVRQNVVLAQRMARRPVADEPVDTLLAQLGLTQFASHKPSQLSQGQAQRVAIARALVHRPALILADEPTSSLDDERAEDVLALLSACATEAGAALLVVTHDNRVRGRLDQELEMQVVT